MLVIEDLHVHYGKIEAVKGISLEIKKGELVTLIGANGAGKTTTLSAVSGLLKASSGRIIFKGIDITAKKADEVIRLGISLVPEGRKIFSKLTVKENLEMGGFIKPREKVKGLLDEVYTVFPVLKDRQGQYGGTLSGGEQQMLAIGRSLMSEPELLLLDEPSLGLSPIMEQTVFRVIKDVLKKGTTILLVEQNANMALKISDRGYVLETGKIALSGEAKILAKNESVRKAYLGE